MADTAQHASPASDAGGGAVEAGPEGFGLMGLYVPLEYGGAGLSQTGYARVFEAFVEGGGSLGGRCGCVSRSG